MLFASVCRARVNPGPTPGSRCPGVHAVVCRDMTSARTRAVTSGSTGATAGSRDDPGSTTSTGGFDEHYPDHCSTRGNVRPPRVADPQVDVHPEDLVAELPL